MALKMGQGQFPSVGWFMPEAPLWGCTCCAPRARVTHSHAAVPWKTWTTLRGLLRVPSAASRWWSLQQRGYGILGSGEPLAVKTLVMIRSMLSCFMEELCSLEYSTLKFAVFYCAWLVGFSCLGSLPEGRTNYIKMSPQSLTVSAWHQVKMFYRDAIHCRCNILTSYSKGFWL